MNKKQSLAKNKMMIQQRTSLSAASSVCLLSLIFFFMMLSTSISSSSLVDAQDTTDSSGNLILLHQGVTYSTSVSIDISKWAPTQDNQLLVENVIFSDGGGLTITGNYVASSSSSTSDQDRVIIVRNCVFSASTGLRFEVNKTKSTSNSNGGGGVLKILIEGNTIENGRLEFCAVNPARPTETNFQLHNTQLSLYKNTATLKTRAYDHLIGFRFCYFSGSSSFVNISSNTLNTINTWDKPALYWLNSYMRAGCAYFSLSHNTINGSGWSSLTTGVVTIATDVEVTSSSGDPRESFVDIRSVMVYGNTISASPPSNNGNPVRITAFTWRNLVLRDVGFNGGGGGGAVVPTTGESDSSSSTEWALGGFQFFNNNLSATTSGTDIHALGFSNSEFKNVTIVTIHKNRFSVETMKTVAFGIYFNYFNLTDIIIGFYLLDNNVSLSVFFNTGIGILWDTCFLLRVGGGISTSSSSSSSSSSSASELAVIYQESKMPSSNLNPRLGGINIRGNHIHVHSSIKTALDPTKTNFQGLFLVSTIVNSVGMMVIDGNEILVNASSSVRGIHMKECDFSNFGFLIIKSNTIQSLSMNIVDGIKLLNLEFSNSLAGLLMIANSVVVEAASGSSTAAIGMDGVGIHDVGIDQGRRSAMMMTKQVFSNSGSDDSFWTEERLKLVSNVALVLAGLDPTASSSSSTSTSSFGGLHICNNNLHSTHTLVNGLSLLITKPQFHALNAVNISGNNMTSTGSIFVPVSSPPSMYHYCRGVLFSLGQISLVFTLAIDGNTINVTGNTYVDGVQIENLRISDIGGGTTMNTNSNVNGGGGGFSISRNTISVYGTQSYIHNLRVQDVNFGNSTNFIMEDNSFLLWCGIDGTSQGQNNRNIYWFRNNIKNISTSMSFIGNNYQMDCGTNEMCVQMTNVLWAQSRIDDVVLWEHRDEGYNCTTPLLKWNLQEALKPKNFENYLMVASPVTNIKSWVFKSNSFKASGYGVVRGLRLESLNVVATTTGGGAGSSSSFSLVVTDNTFDLQVGENGGTSAISTENVVMDGAAPAASRVTPSSSPIPTPASSVLLARNQITITAPYGLDNVPGDSNGFYLRTLTIQNMSSFEIIGNTMLVSAFYANGRGVYFSLVLSEDVNTIRVDENDVTIDSVSLSMDGTGMGATHVSRFSGFAGINFFKTKFSFSSRTSSSMTASTSGLLSVSRNIISVKGFDTPRGILWTSNLSPLKDEGNGMFGGRFLMDSNTITTLGQNGDSSGVQLYYIGYYYLAVISWRGNRISSHCVNFTRVCEANGIQTENLVALNIGSPPPLPSQQVGGGGGSGSGHTPLEGLRIIGNKIHITSARNAAAGIDLSAVTFSNGSNFQMSCNSINVTILKTEMDYGTSANSRTYGVIIRFASLFSSFPLFEVTNNSIASYSIDDSSVGLFLICHFEHISLVAISHNTIQAFGLLRRSLSNGVEGVSPIRIYRISKTDEAGGMMIGVSNFTISYNVLRAYSSWFSALVISLDTVQFKNMKYWSISYNDIAFFVKRKQASGIEFEYVFFSNIDVLRLDGNRISTLVPKSRAVQEILMLPQEAAVMEMTTAELAIAPKSFYDSLWPPGFHSFLEDLEVAKEPLRTSYSTEGMLAGVLDGGGDGIPTGTGASLPWSSSPSSYTINNVPILDSIIALNATDIAGIRWRGLNLANVSLFSISNNSILLHLRAIEDSNGVTIGAGEIENISTGIIIQGNNIETAVWNIRTRCVYLAMNQRKVKFVSQILIAENRCVAQAGNTLAWGIDLRPTSSLDNLAVSALSIVNNTVLVFAGVITAAAINFQGGMLSDFVCSQWLNVQGNLLFALQGNGMWTHHIFNPPIEEKDVAVAVGDVTGIDVSLALRDTPLAQFQNNVIFVKGNAGVRGIYFNAAVTNITSSLAFINNTILVFATKRGPASGIQFEGLVQIFQNIRSMYVKSNLFNITAASCESKDVPVAAVFWSTKPYGIQDPATNTEINTPAIFANNFGMLYVIDGSGLDSSDGRFGPMLVPASSKVHPLDFMLRCNNFYANNIMDTANRLGSPARLFGLGDPSPTKVALTNTQCDCRKTFDCINPFSALGAISVSNSGPEGQCTCTGCATAVIPNGMGPSFFSGDVATPGGQCQVVAQSQDFNALLRNEGDWMSGPSMAEGGCDNVMSLETDRPRSITPTPNVDDEGENSTATVVIINHHDNDSNATRTIIANDGAINISNSSVPPVNETPSPAPSSSELTNVPSSNNATAAPNNSTGGSTTPGPPSSDSNSSSTNTTTVPSPSSNGTTGPRTPSPPSTKDANATRAPAPPAAGAASVALESIGMSESSATAVASTATTSAVVASIANPGAATSAVRVGSILGAVNCAYSEDTSSLDPPAMMFPVRYPIGSGPFSVYVGAVVYNVVVFLLVPCLILVGLHLTLNRHKGGISGNAAASNSAASLAMGSSAAPLIVTTPSTSAPPAFSKTTKRLSAFLEKLYSPLMTVLIGYFLPSICSATMLILRHGDRGLDKGIALCVWLIATAAAVIGPFYIIATPKFNSVITDNTEMSLENNSGREKIVWMNVVPTESYAETLAAFYDGCGKPSFFLARVYFFEDILVSCLLGTIDGWRPTTGTCIPIAVAMFIVTALHLIYLLLVRPYRAHLEFFFVFLIAVLQVLMAGLSIGVISNSDLGSALGYVVMVQSLLFFVQALVMGFWTWYVFKARRERRRALRRQTATAGGGGVVSGGSTSGGSGASSVPTSGTALASPVSSSATMSNPLLQQQSHSTGPHSGAGGGLLSVPLLGNHQGGDEGGPKDDEEDEEEMEMRAL